MVALILCFATSSTVTYSDGWRERYGEREEQRELVRLIRRVEKVQMPEVRSILLHRKGKGKVFHFHYFNDSYFLPDYTFRTYKRRVKLRPKGDLVLSGSTDFGDFHPGARLLGLENFSYRKTGYMQALWVLPGLLQETLADGGWLLPEGFPGALQREVLKSELRILEPGFLAKPLVRGRDLWLPLEVTHRGSAPWPHRGGLGTAEHSVRLVASWFSVDSSEPIAQQGADLPRVLYPGDAARVVVKLSAQTTMPAGRYRVTVGIAQEIAGQLGTLGEGALDLMIEVE
jgi:hypothetical protein